MRISVGRKLPVRAEKAIFAEDNKGVGFAARHAERGDGEELLPGNFFNLIQRKNEVAVFLIHGELLRFVGDGVAVQIQCAAQNAVAAKAAEKYFFQNKHSFCFIRRDSLSRCVRYRPNRFALKTPHRGFFLTRKPSRVRIPDPNKRKKSGTMSEVFSCERTV